MQFPYGIADFQRIIENKLFYVDRTALISDIERAGDQLLFLRPRRFGKSLLLSMLENYYDIAKADQFSSLFGHLAIGSHPTPLHNHYVVMKWDFSLIAATGSAEEIEQRLHQHINERIRSISQSYKSILKYDVRLSDNNAMASFESLINAIRNSDHKLYLLIDEYDNFANELMMGSSDSHYQSLLHGEGAVRSIFKGIKAAAAGMGLERVFITGVSPIAMSDITSAYNVASNIYLLPEFNQLCGFTENEVSNALHRMLPDDKIDTQIKTILQNMRTFYNGYRFSEEATTLMFNPTMALYFLNHFQRYGKPPKQMLDNNLSMDRNKIHYIARLHHGAEVIGKVLDDAQPISIASISERFGVRQMVEHEQDQTGLLSLLYYLGALTLADSPYPGEIGLKIPNLVMRRLYVEEVQAACFPHLEEDRLVAARPLYTQADISPLCRLLEGRIFKTLSNRDYRWSNELSIKMAFLVSLFNDVLFIMDSEPELNRGYADMSMIVRPDMRHYDIYDVLMEFKFISLADIGMNGEAIANASEDELLKLAEVSHAFDEAKSQLQRYIPGLQQKYGEVMKLCSFAVVAVGFDRLLWKSIE